MGLYHLRWGGYSYLGGRGSLSDGERGKVRDGARLKNLRSWSTTFVGGSSREGVRVRGGGGWST